MRFTKKQDEAIRLRNAARAVERAEWLESFVGGIPEMVPGDEEIAKRCDKIATDAADLRWALHKRAQI